MNIQANGLEAKMSTDEEKNIEITLGSEGSLSCPVFSQSALPISSKGM